MSEDKKPTKSQSKRHQRREKVRKLHFECISAREIARRLKASFSTIRRDLEYFDRKFRDALPHEGPTSLAEELERLRHLLEGEASKAWRRSQKPATTETNSIEEGGTHSKSKATKISRSQVGNHQFLEVISKSVLRRYQLLHMKQMDDTHGQDTFLQFEAICQEKSVYTELFEGKNLAGGIQDVYTCLIREDSQPRELEVGPTFGGVRSSADGPGDGTPIEVDRADATETREI